METIAFLGCSRGLGRSVVETFSQQNPDIKALLVSRNQTALGELASVINHCEILCHDFSKSSQVDELISQLERQKLQRLFYFAGGGPYGLFKDKDWKDHEWALQVSFLTPARLLHHFSKSNKGLKQFIVIGSLIADDKADPMASSYASAKHAVKGLVDSINNEGAEMDVRIFRPSYIDTDLLPPQARPRKEGKALLKPEYVAQVFSNWAMDPKGPKSLDLEAPR